MASISADLSPFIMTKFITTKLHINKDLIYLAVLLGVS